MIALPARWILAAAIPRSRYGRLRFSSSRRLLPPPEPSPRAFPGNGNGSGCGRRAVLPAGGHVLSWDGRNAGGAPLPNGVYFVRMQAGVQSRTLKLVRLP